MKNIDFAGRQLLLVVFAFFALCTVAFAQESRPLVKSQSL
jgi:hypothetical protein